MKRCGSLDPRIASKTEAMPCVLLEEHLGPCAYAKGNFDSYNTCLNCGEGPENHVCCADAVRCLFAPTTFETLKGWGSK